MPTNLQLLREFAEYLNGDDSSMGVLPILELEEQFLINLINPSGEEYISVIDVTSEFAIIKVEQDILVLEQVEVDEEFRECGFIWSVRSALLNEFSLAV